MVTQKFHKCCPEMPFLNCNFCEGVICCNLDYGIMSCVIKPIIHSFIRHCQLHRVASFQTFINTKDSVDPKFCNKVRFFKRGPKNLLVFRLNIHHCCFPVSVCIVLWSSGSTSFVTVASTGPGTNSVSGCQRLTF